MSTTNWDDEYKKARALKATIEAKRMHEEFIPRAEHERILVARAIAVRDRFLGLGRKLACDLYGLQVPNIQRKIEQAVAEILEDIAATRRVEPMVDDDDEDS